MSAALRIPERDESLGQWMTDERLARAFVRWADVRRGQWVLEPGAGSGNLVAACLEAGAEVAAEEIDPRWVEYLRRRFESSRRVLVGPHDFLGQRLTFEHPGPSLALLNPPFEQDQEALWIAESVAITGRACAIIRLHGLAGASRYAHCWSQVRLTRVSVCVPRPPFHGSGVHEIAVVEAVRRARPRRRGETDRVAFGHLHWQEAA